MEFWRVSFRGGASEAEAEAEAVAEEVEEAEEVDAANAAARLQPALR